MNAIVLLLPAGPGNPRNSEGAFVTLRDGRILFAWSRYTGADWADHARADLAASVSADGGLTWGPPRIIVPNEGRCNVMSVSLLRLHDGRIALFYVQKNSALDCRLRVRFSSDEAETWSDSVLCQPARGYFVTHNDRVVQLRDSRLLVASAFHRAESTDGDIVSGITMRAEACFFYSDDGVTWRERPQRLHMDPAITAGLQ
ncbi:MAG: exo-alpha-sialidase [Opitutaceae bacterium]|nr:exo-alpha-sialidase [Opitutaceae bacterium]